MQKERKGSRGRKRKSGGIEWLKNSMTKIGKGKLPKNKSRLLEHKFPKSKTQKKLRLQLS